MKDGNGSGFFAGFLTGATLGAVAALLFAPKSGRELRQDLAEGRDRARRRVSEAARELSARSHQAIEATRDTLHQAAQGVKDASRKLRAGD